MDPAPGGMIHNKIHFHSPECPRPYSAESWPKTPFMSFPTMQYSDTQYYIRFQYVELGVPAASTCRGDVQRERRPKLGFLRRRLFTTWRAKRLNKRGW